MVKASTNGSVCVMPVEWKSSLICLYQLNMLTWLPSFSVSSLESSLLQLRSGGVAMVLGLISSLHSNRIRPVPFSVPSLSLSLPPQWGVFSPSCRTLFHFPSEMWEGFPHLMFRKLPCDISERDS